VVVLFIILLGIFLILVVVYRTCCTGDYRATTAVPTAAAVTLLRLTLLLRL